MRLAVAATPEVAIPTLNLLRDSTHTLAAVITQPDRRAGRGLAVKESPVAIWAKDNQIPTFKPQSQQDLSEIASNFDLIITIGFGMIIQESILHLPRYGFINLHFSLLPRWRGAAPVQRAIEAGDSITGVSVFKLDKGMDTGPIFRQVPFTIGQQSTTQNLLSELAQLGAPIVLETIEAIAAGESPRLQDSSSVTRAEKLTREEGRIDWHLPADVIERKVRAFFPSPGSWSTFRGSVIRIDRVELFTNFDDEPGELRIVNKDLVITCGENSLKIVEITPAGKSVMPASAWLNGAHLRPGEKFV